MKKILLIVLCLGIGNVNAQKTAKKVQSNVTSYEKNMIKKYGAKAVTKANSSEIWIGMTEELCLFGLSTPNQIKKSHTKEGTSDVWIYHGQASGCIGDCPYLDYIITFKNHVIASFTEGE